MGARQITFLTDYGREDVFVGLCHAVMAAIAPTAPVADLTHDIPPQDVRAGAMALADCVVHVPAAVHLAVVDPGVGSAREGIVLMAGDALLVGPDNGLLLPAARRMGGVSAAYRLGEPRLRAPRVSRTFHGRDIFAPAAAHLANGAEPSEFGAALDAGRLVELTLPSPTVEDGALIAPVRGVDRFGNVQLAATAADLARAGLSDAQRLHLTRVASLDSQRPGEPSAHRLVADRRSFDVSQVEIFADLAHGELGLIEDSFGWLAVVTDRDHAARRLRLQVTDAVRIVAP